MSMMLEFTFGKTHRSDAALVATMATWWKIGQAKGQNKAPSYQLAARTALKRWRGRAIDLAKALGESHEERQRLMWRMCNCTPSGIATSAPGRSHPITCGNPACIWCAHRHVRDTAQELLRAADLARRLHLDLQLIALTTPSYYSQFDEKRIFAPSTWIRHKALRKLSVGCRSTRRLTPAPRGTTGFAHTTQHIVFAKADTDPDSFRQGSATKVQAARLKDPKAVRKLLIEALAYPTQFVFGDVEVAATVCRAMSIHRPRWRKTWGLIKAADELFEAVGRLPRLSGEMEAPVDEDASSTAG